jgi:MFS family permease
MLPLKLFQSRNFLGANLLTLFLYAALSGALFFFPLNLIQVQGYSATAAGAALLPFILIMFVLSRWSGGLTDRFGPKLPLTIGPMVAGAGFVLFAFPGLGASYWRFLPAVVVLGLGLAVSVAPLTTTVMGSVAESQAGIASGINNAVSRTAGLLAIAVLGIAMLYGFSYRLERNLSQSGLSIDVQTSISSQRVKLGAIELPGDLDTAAKERLKQSVGDSFVFGFRVVVAIAAALAVASAVSAWVWISRVR